MESIRYGTTIKTPEGYLLAVEYDGYRVTVEEYRVAERSEEMIDVRDVTLEDLARAMQALDGKRHWLYWDNSITCERCCYYWKEEWEDHPSCHFERVLDIPAPCEE